MAGKAFVHTDSSPSSKVKQIIGAEAGMEVDRRQLTRVRRINIRKRAAFLMQV